MRSLKIIGVGFGITAIAVCFAVNGYRSSLIEASRTRVVTPNGFSRSPALTEVSGYYTFIDDNHILFSNDGSAKATTSGITNVTDSRIHKITISQESDKGCNLIQTPAIIVNLQNGETLEPSLSLAKFVGFSRSYGGYAFPGDNRNRVSGACGSVIANLDGASQLRSARPEEKLGDIYWKAIGSFIDFNLKSVDSHSCIVVPKMPNGKEYGTIEINKSENEFRILRGIIGVDSRQRLILTTNTSAGEVDGIYFGRLANEKVELEDYQKFQPSDNEKLAVSRDGRKLAYIHWNDTFSRNEIFVRNLENLEEKIVGTYTATWIQSMSFSPNNTYLALQLRDGVAWTKL